MPIPFYRCRICRREFPDMKIAEQCEQAHLEAVSVSIKSYGIHKYPYLLNVTFSDGKILEYSLDKLR